MTWPRRTSACGLRAGPARGPTVSQTCSSVRVLALPVQDGWHARWIDTSLSLALPAKALVKNGFCVVDILLNSVHARDKKSKNGSDKEVCLGLRLRHATDNVSTTERISLISYVVDTSKRARDKPVLLLGEAPRDRSRCRLPGSALSRCVPACLTCLAAAYRTGTLLWSHSRSRTRPSPYGVRSAQHDGRFRGVFSHSPPTRRRPVVNRYAPV